MNNVLDAILPENTIVPAAAAAPSASPKGDITVNSILSETAAPAKKPTVNERLDRLEGRLESVATALETLAAISLEFYSNQPKAVAPTTIVQAPAKAKAAKPASKPKAIAAPKPAAEKAPRQTRLEKEQAAGRALSNALIQDGWKAVNARLEGSDVPVLRSHAYDMGGTFGVALFIGAADDAQAKAVGGKAMGILGATNGRIHRTETKDGGRSGSAWIMMEGIASL